MSLKQCDLGFVAGLLFPSELFTLLEAAFPFLCKSLSQLFCSTASVPFIALSYPVLLPLRKKILNI